MDLIDRREAMAELYDVFFDDDLKAAYPDKVDVVLDVIRKLPSALTDEKRTEELTETHSCDYCHEDSDGYVKPIEKNCHAVIFGSVLYLKANGWRGEVEIKYCPMCGRRLTNG